MIHTNITREARNSIGSRKLPLAMAQSSNKEKFLEINRNAHVLLNLLNEFGKRDIMRGLTTILSLFRSEFGKFNNARA